MSKATYANRSTPMPVAMVHLILDREPLEVKVYDQFGDCEGVTLNLQFLPDTRELECKAEIPVLLRHGQERNCKPFSLSFTCSVDCEDYDEFFFNGVELHITIDAIFLTDAGTVSIDSQFFTITCTRDSAGIFPTVRLK